MRRRRRRRSSHHRFCLLSRAGDGGKGSLDANLRNGLMLASWWTSRITLASSLHLRWCHKTSRETFFSVHGPVGLSVGYCGSHLGFLEEVKGCFLD